MRLLFGTDGAFERHDPGPFHPERPERLRAVAEGLADVALGSDLELFAPRDATDAELLRVHSEAYVRAVAAACSVSAALDPDTMVGPDSWPAALAAAGAGVDAIGRLRAGDASAAFLAVRPPGHHARADQAMGFCLFNNAAVAAASLVAEGERVLVLDWDAHHGNGTQEIFYESGDVLVVSLHQYPFYPGTGAVTERGAGAGLGATVNLPFPAGTAGDAYRRAFDEVVVPAAELFSPSWLIVSCGFDAHRDDPLTDLGLTAGDFADLTERALRLSAPGRRLFFLEGGYDLDALRHCTAATVAALVGEELVPERRSGGSLGRPGWADPRVDGVLRAAAGGLVERFVIA